ncbi:MULTISPECIES: antibiotic biosynthesis monooxygenase [unclassified Paenibacillus]|uniref:antibiotic biosynthesis monooxygenase family protein n=1 Tax=unclassified Paenibacillus TaxID=185978 RepID=UPI0024BB77F2|nr:MULTISPECIES: antibiotic biosynthesis monooxygenase [unclassified Paenibacillus]
MNSIAKTPQPPYYAAIFTSERTEGDGGYGKMGDKMEELAAEQPGFLGMESVRDQNGVGITVSYWESLDAIKNWKQNELHKVAQEKGKAEWYKTFGLRVSKVERDYFFTI